MILYRAVRSLMSAPDPTNELQVEVFVLRAQGSEELGAANGSVAFSTETREPASQALMAKAPS
jgi:hypothetical protein